MQQERGDWMIISIEGNAAEFPEGTSVYEAGRTLGAVAENTMLAEVNGKLCEIFKNLYKDSEIRFLDVTTAPGRKTCERGLTMVLLAAVKNVYGIEFAADLMVEHTIGPGLFCELKGQMPDNFIEMVKAEMKRIVDADYAISKKSMNTQNARNLFASRGMNDKAELFRYRRSSKTNVYTLENYTDYFYGYMPMSTGFLSVFDLVAYKDGFLLMLPDSEHPETVPEMPVRDKLYNALKVSNRWGRDMNIVTVGDLNRAISEGKTEHLILVQEALQEKKLGDIAELIKARENCKFVMIAGPSSSGKTSFANRLSVQLETLGLHPHPISLDNFYKNREDCPKNADGSYNFECLEALDVELFNSLMQKLLRGETAELPVFNFKTGLQEANGERMTLGEDDILVIEGIHGLNDRLSYTLPKESKFKIYISALTELNVDLHNRIPTTDGRLLRRMIRDARTRGISAQHTIAMWPSVRAGEEQYIFPFQEEADYTFNSASIYELSVIKQYAEPLLFGIPEDAPEFCEAQRLLKFLDYFLSIPAETIPHNSLVREFVGGSCFNV